MILARRPIIFTHIPKTGGTSLREMIYRAVRDAGVDDTRIHIPGYGNVHISYNTSDMSSDEIDRLREKNLICLADHGFYGIHERLGIRNPFYFTFLREPVSSFISSYYFLMEMVLVEKSEIHREEYRSLFGNNALEDITEEGTIPEIETFPLDRIRLLSRLYKEPILFSLGLPDDKSGFNSAIKRLRQDYEFVGIFEHFEESVKRLSHLAPSWLNLNDQQIIHRNRGVYHRKKVPSSLADVIREYRKYDLRIYQYACSLFKQTVVR